MHTTKIKYSEKWRKASQPFGLKGTLNPSGLENACAESTLKSVDFFFIIFAAALCIIEEKINLDFDRLIFYYSHKLFDAKKFARLGRQL